MKRLLTSLAIALSLGCVSAAPLYFDPFVDATANGGTTYTVGSALANQKNNSANIWNAVNNTSGGPQLPTIVAGNLSYPNLPPSSGNAVSFIPSTNGQSVRLNFGAGVTTNAAYYSYKLKITDISVVPSTNANNPFAGWSDANTAQPGAPVARVGSKILTKTSGGGFVLGIGRNNTVSDYVYDTTVHTVGETLFVVASYELTGGVTNVNLWVNPPTNSFGSNTPPTVTATAHAANLSGDINASRVQGFLILCQSSNAPSGVIDDVRLGTNWSDVTGGDPAIVSQPANQNVQSGHNATFAVVARGTATLTYLWSKDGTPLSNGGNISGATNATLTVSGVSAGDLGGYSVLVSNGLGSVQSVTATLAFQTDPTIATQPVDVTTNFGGSATFTVTASGTSPFTYQWHKVGTGDLSDGGNVIGSHTSALSLSSLTGNDTAAYSVTVGNVNGSVDSSNANLTVIDPYFTLNPVSTNAGSGATATFTVTAVGTGISFYQWYKNNGTLLVDLGNISGSGSQTLTIANASASDQANYFATVTGSFGTSTSTVASLTVSTPVSIAIQPSPRTVAPGVRTVFAVGASGSAPFTYQWQLNGANISGANAFFYTVSNAQASVAGNYQVIVSNSFSSATSSIVALTVSNVVLNQSNLMIIRVGDGGQTLNLTGNSMYVDQYKTDGTYVSTVTIPDSGPSSMVTLGMDNQGGVNSGATTGSCITRSLDGRFMVIAGYNTNLTYTTNLSTTPAAVVPHGIGLIDSRGFYTLPLADTHSNYDSTTWRAGITDGTNNFFGGASTVGTFYFGFDAAPGLVQNTMVNMRSMSLYNGDIYCAGAQAGAIGVLKIPGMPKGAGSASLLFAGSTGTFDMTVSPSGNLIYVADQRALGAGAIAGGIQRWDFNGTAWNLTYTLQIGGTSSAHNGPRYLVGDFSGANPILYATANDGTLDNNHLVVVQDTGAGSTATALATAGANQTFRGIQFGPVVNTIISNASITATTNGAGNLVLHWTAPFSLQSSTNVQTGYTNVPGASNPYTNTLNGDAQRFFRLRQLE